MLNSNYDHWWSLHLRVARGELLSEAEQVEYRQGQTHLDDQVEMPGDDTLSFLRTLRAAINRAAAVHTARTATSAELEKEIAALEAAYQGLTGHRLNLEPYVSA